MTFLFFFLRYFMWTIFNVFIEFVAVLFLCLCFGVTAARLMCSYLPDQEVNPRTLHCKAKS